MVVAGPLRVIKGAWLVRKAVANGVSLVGLDWLPMLLEVIIVANCLMAV